MMQPRYVELEGPTHLAHFGGDGPPMVLVHGLGGAHTNWLAVGDRLAETHRVVAVDLVGHGRTPVAGRDATIDGHQRLLDQVLRTAVDGPVTLVGNSMGGLVSLLQTAREPDTVRELVLIGPAVPSPRSVRPDREVLRNFLLYLPPGVGEWHLARLDRTMTPAERVQMTLDLCTVDATRVPDRVKDAALELAHERRRMPWTAEAFLSSTRSMVPLLLKRREVDDAIGRISAPTLVVQGRHDRLVDPAAIDRLASMRPDWTIEVFEDSGHVPMMEHPDRFVATLEAWQAGRAGTSAAA